MKKETFYRNFFYAVFLILFYPTFMKSQNSINEQTKIKYPTIKADVVTNNYFGVFVNDGYRVLESTEQPEVKKWLSEERVLTDSILGKIKYRDSISRKLSDPLYSSNFQGGFPRPSDKRLFFTRKFLKEKVQKLFYKDDISGTEIEIFTTQTVNNSNNTYNIDYFEPSYDGNYVAFGISANGDEKTSLKVIDVVKKEILSESIPGTLYGNPQWIPGKNAFFYSQFKDVKSEEDKKTVYEDSRVKIHFIGTSSDNDKEVFSRHLNSNLKIDKIDLLFFSVFPSSDKVVAFAAHGSSSYLSLFSCDLSSLIKSNTSTPSWKTICLLDEKATNFAVNKNDFFMMSFKDNPNGSLKKIDLNQPIFSAISIKEAKDEAFEDLITTKEFIYLKSVKNCIGSFEQIDPVNNKSNEIVLPFQGAAYLRASIAIPPFYSHSNLFFFGMESWNHEFGVYYYNPDSKEIGKTKTRIESKIDATDILTKEIEIKSFDGVMVPVSIIYSKSAELNGKNPTLVRAYGAYGNSINPTFDLSIISWVRMGGIYVVAHVRGGGEKGDNWYKGGLKSTKSNSWKDFISCTEYLIKNNYTTPNKLAAIGTSAGGIAVGMALVTRPDLFRAGILEVGVLNALRFENSKNSLNVTEFGSSSDSTEFKYLYDMDVYHHIKEDVLYPSLLITGDLKDSRVEIWQPAKAAAKFQEVSKGKSNIVLFKVKESGHFGDFDKQKSLADNYAFLFWQLNHVPSNLQ
jgi:prolyl oligopeptidase